MRHSVARLCYAGIMKTRSLNHSVYKLEYHIVWGTKYRRKFLVKGIEKEFLKHLRAEITKYPTLQMVAANTDRDHVHLQIEIPPNVTIASVVQRMKAATSLHLRKKFRVIKEMYLDKEGIWSVGYFVSSLGLNDQHIKRYIEWQGKRDVPQTMVQDTQSKQLRLEFS